MLQQLNRRILNAIPYFTTLFWKLLGLQIHSDLRISTILQEKHLIHKMKLLIKQSSPWRFSNSPHLEKADLPFRKLSGIGLWSYGLGQKKNNTTVWLTNVACVSVCLLGRSKALTPQLVENSPMICLKSEFISLLFHAYSNPKLQGGMLGSVLTKWGRYLQLVNHWSSPSPLMFISASKDHVGV